MPEELRPTAESVGGDVAGVVIHWRRAGALCMRPRVVFIGIRQDSEMRLSKSDGSFERLSVQAVRERLHPSSSDDVTAEAVAVDAADAAVPSRRVSRY